MPSESAESSSIQNANKGKRQTAGRVVPAIPLALTKPKTTKPRLSPPNNLKAGVLSEDHAIKAEIQRDENDGWKPVVEPIKRRQSPLRTPVVGQQLGEAEDQTNSSSFKTIALSGEILAAPMDPAHPDVIQAARTLTPPAVSEVGRSSPTVTASSGSARKPTDRFDMRQIRTELPPAFVPSAEQQTPQSATSSSQSRPQLPILSHGHPIHQSAGSIVFGGHDSSTSSPAPPHSAGSGFVPPSFPNQHNYSGHSHRGSESAANRMYVPGYAQPPMPWSSRSGFVSPLPPPHHNMSPQTSPSYSYCESFTPTDAVHITVYGRYSQAGPQVSTVTQENHIPTPDLQSPTGLEQLADIARNEKRGGYPGAHNRPRQHPFPPHAHAYPPAQQYQHPELASSFENSETLRGHILNQFGIPEFADCYLEIADDFDSITQNMDCHKVILARSPTLLELIRESDPLTCVTLKPQVQVRLQGQYVRLAPFMDALKYLYGGVLPTLPPYKPGDHGLTNEERMEITLQHIATATWLQIPAIAQRGVVAAANLLHWDTIGTGLAFALDGGLSQAWTVDDGSEERVSTCSSDDSQSRPETGGSPTFEPYATYLLHRILDFVVHMLPPSFYLDASAPELASYSRLPSTLSTHQSRPSRSDPRLSKIRFGEIPIEDHQRPSFVATTVSSMLLSLPFPLLKFVLEHFELTNRLGAETVSSIMRQVVGEREVRRQKALKLRPVAHADDTTDVRIQNLYWEELVEPSALHRAGFRLARRKRGIDTPPSSGTESEQPK